MNLCGVFSDYKSETGFILTESEVRDLRFDDLLRENIVPLERFVYYRIGNPEDAKDVIQETCLAAFSGFDRLKDESFFKAWIIGIARNKCNDYYRRKAKTSEVMFEDLESELPPVNIYGITESSIIDDTLEALDARSKQILELYYLNDMPQAEIAKRLGIPVGTVKSRLHNAKVRFREKYPFNTNLKEERNMKTLPETMPKYTIIKSDAEPFDVVCEELPGWLIVPRVGEHLIFGSYESPSGLLLDTEELKAENEVEIHGVRGVRISCLIKSYDLSELCRKGDHEEHRMDLVASLADTRCRFLAQGQLNNGIYQLRTFLDGDAFNDDWGFGEDNCGAETHLSKKGEITAVGSVITCAELPYSISDIVGRYTVTIGGMQYDTVRRVIVEPEGSKVLTEQYITKDGKTVLWRRFNRNDWGFGRYGKLWTELRPNNERLTVNGETFVHWYDCITDYIL